VLQTYDKAGLNLSTNAANFSQNAPK